MNGQTTDICDCRFSFATENMNMIKDTDFMFNDLNVAGYCEKEILEQYESFVKMCPDGTLRIKCQMMNKESFSSLS